jgi:hypothetical protein
MLLNNRAKQLEMPKMPKKLLIKLLRKEKKLNLRLLLIRPRPKLLLQRPKRHHLLKQRTLKDLPIQHGDLMLFFQILFSPMLSKRSHQLLDQHRLIKLVNQFTNQQWKEEIQTQTNPDQFFMVTQPLSHQTTPIQPPRVLAMLPKLISKQRVKPLTPKLPRKLPKMPRLRLSREPTQRKRFKKISLN